MDPRIQYATTEDGVSIAYWTIGVGRPLVFMPRTPFTHIQAEWEVGYRPLYEGLANGRMLVRYDGRGSRPSERNDSDFSLAAQMRDLVAVANCLEADEFDLLGYTHSGPVAVAYAAANPKRVTHLLLWQSYIRSSDLAKSPKYQSLMGILQTDWELFRDTAGQVFFDWTSTDGPRRFAAFMGDCVSHEGAKEAYAALRSIDVEALLPKVEAPTLVMQVRGAVYPGLEVAREMTANIPDAELALLEGTSMAPFQNDVDGIVQAIDEFLGEGEDVSPKAAAEQAGGFATILFTDMESSTALTQTLGDAKAQELVRVHNIIVREALSAHDGTEIKHTGDGIMASFGTASGALACAVTIQRAVAARADERPEVPLGLRIGLNAGEPVVEEQDLFGASVQLAKRICDHAEPGQILASNVVRELAMGKGFLFGDIGEVVPKGFEEPVRLYEVNWQEEM